MSKTVSESLSELNVAKRKIGEVVEKLGGTAGGFNDMTDELERISETVMPLPDKGFVFENYDADGYPTTGRFVGNWVEIPTSIFANLFHIQKVSAVPQPTAFLNKIKTITVPEGVTTIGRYAFYYCDNLETINLPSTLTNIVGDSFNYCAVETFVIPGDVTIGGNVFGNVTTKEFIFLGSITKIERNCFIGCKNVELYDFSHCATIPSLYSVGSLGHASGCVIKVPQSLLSEWQSATNWADLTDIVWEGV